MAFVIADRVRETSTSTGTGNFTLGGAVTGYQTFASVMATSDTTYYTIADQGGANWEVGIGTFTSPSTLARTTILSSSNGGSVVTFGAGTKDVFISLPASKTNVEDQPNLIEVNSSSAALRITQTGAGNALVVEDSANPDATPFIVDSLGNVGIGTTTPGSALDISGSSFIRNTRYASDAAYVQRRANGTAASPTISLNGESSIQRFDFYDGVGFIPGAQISAVVDGTPGTNDMPGRLVFSTTADGASTPTERMRINNTGTIGIGNAGTTAATLGVAKTLTGATTAYGILATGQVQSDVTSLTYGVLSQSNTQATAFTLGEFRHFAAIQGTIGATSAITNQHGFYVASSLTGATNNYGFYGNIASGSGRWNFYAAGTADNYFAGQVQLGAGTAAAPALSTTGDTNTGIFFPAADTIAFSEGGVESMRIDSSGNVGIGVAAPNERLHVAGNIVSSDGSPQGGALLFGSPSYPALAGAGSLLSLNGGGYYSAVEINGYVGIGTSSPSHNLTINGGADSYTQYLSGVPGTNFLVGLNYIGDAVLYNAGYTPLVFSTNGFERMRIAEYGFVGIGTSSPNEALEVSNGNLVLSNSAQDQFIRVGYNRFADGLSYIDLQGDTQYFDGMRLIRQNNGPNSNSNIEHRGTGALQLITQESAPITFLTSATERARIDSSGNIIAGASAALATNATNGFLYVPTCAGTPTGTPTAVTGMAPIVVNTTNNKLYFYSGGAWRDAGP
jgi:hypothetical protein